MTKHYPEGYIQTSGEDSTTTTPTPIRRRRSTKRRAWGPTARFFLGWLFRRMNG